MTYEDFFPEADVATYKRVKRGTMRLARVARGTVAAMLELKIERGPNRKELLVTPQGTFRLAMSHDSDNDTEKREHERLGAKTVVMGDAGEMIEFFKLHGIDRPLATYLTFRHRVNEEMAK